MLVKECLEILMHISNCSQISFQNQCKNIFFFFALTVHKKDFRNSILKDCCFKRGWETRRRMFWFIIDVQ